MLKARIFELVGSIPIASNVYSEAPPANRCVTSPPTPADVLINRRACALLDPSFPWKYAEAFAQLRQPLPAMVSEPFIKTAYDVLLHRTSDGSISEAQVFQHPKWANKRGFLEALLLLPSLRLDEVAKYAGISVSTVMAYEGLFWSVRDRLQDQMFMAELFYPESRRVEFQPDYFAAAAPRDLMVRAAFHDDLETILQIFGARTKPNVQSAGLTAKQVKARILADADLVIRAGGSSSKVPVLEAARKMFVATEKNVGPNLQSIGDDRMGLTAVGLTPGKSIMDAVQRLTDDTLFKKRLALYDAAKADSN